MSKSSFKQGFVVGVLGPLAFLGGLIYWIYRYTGRVPFLIRRPAQEELTLKLVFPEEVPGYWQQWKALFTPLLAKVRELGQEFKPKPPSVS